MYFSLTDDSVTDYYFLGECISSTPLMAPQYRYGVAKEAYDSCLMWYGDGGMAVFLAVENGELFVYEVNADVPIVEVMNIAQSVEHCGVQRRRHNQSCTSIDCCY